MKSYIKMRNALLLLISLLTTPLFVASCSDEPDAENFYTRKGEMITDYLNNRYERYSLFTDILHRAEIYDLLSTYGEYTCFAPTNDAVRSYLSQRGYSSVAELPKEDCDTIAYTHLIKKTYFTTDLNDGAIPTSNMLERYLIISNDTVSSGQIVYFINKSSRLIVRDDSVENGVVHTLNQVVTPSNDMLPDLLAKDERITLWYSALVATGLDDSLRLYLDERYTIGEDSVIDGVTYNTAVEIETAFYPANRKYAYTAFVEPDSVFNQRGIYTLEDLTNYAKSIYDETYPEDAGHYDQDVTHRKNPLNRFMAYHLLDRLGNYNELTLTGDGNRYMNIATHLDMADYYETLAPFTIMQCSYPNSTMYINRRGVGQNYTVRGIRVLSPSETSDVDQSALNGVYHYIDDILTYNTRVRDIVFNVRMRMDATTLSPEFMTSGARGREGYDECTGFKNGYLKNWKFTDETLVSCRNRHFNFYSYQGDEVVLLGQYDFTFKLPPVPEGTYEIRLGYCRWNTRGVIQAYYDGLPCGIPLDLRLQGDNPKIGWQALSSNEETNKEIEKAMRNRGYMPGPRGVRLYDGVGYTIFRTVERILRRIIITTYIDDKSDHYVRFKQTLDNPRAEFAFDYIELCPKSVYDSERGDDGY